MPGLNLSPLRFAGQYFDAETGLHYNYHRYFDPDLARYLSADPVGLMGGTNAQMYVSNPTALVDPPLGGLNLPGRGRSSRFLGQGPGDASSRSRRLLTGGRATE